MRATRRFFHRLAGIFGRKRSDDRWQRELEQHLAFQTEENLRAGLPSAEARRHAVLKFGVLESIAEDYRSERALPLFETLAQDARFAMRTFHKSPGFAAVAILTVALGIGATTAIFSIVDATLIHPLPYPHPEQLVNIQDDLPGIGAQAVGMSVPEWQDLQRSGIFEYVSPIAGGDVNLTGASQPTRIRFLNIPPNYFATIGLKPQLGSTFDPEDRTPGFTLDVLISDGLWKRVFASDPQVIGKSLRLDNDLYRVIGVMPPGYHDPGRTAEERNVDLWAASGFAGPPAPPPLRSTRLLPRTIARLKPGLSIDVAQTRVDALVAALQKQFPAEYPLQSGWSIRLTPLKDAVVGNVRCSLILLLGAVGLVLLIGSVNLANLLLARASGRAREMAVRQALGAARPRLVRQLLTESLLLSIIGGAGGLILVLCFKGFLLRVLPDTVPRLNEVSINLPVLLFALLVSLIAGAIFGLAPALHAGRLDLIHALRQEGRGSTGSSEQARTRRALVVTEFALSLVLMIVSGLLLRSFWMLQHVPLGFAASDVMCIRTWLPVPNDPSTDVYGTPAKEAPLLREALRRVRALPGVEEAAIGDLQSIPLRGIRNDLNPNPLTIDGRANANGQPPLVDRTLVTPEYFHLLRITLQTGRLFNEMDNETAQNVAIVNQAFAQMYFPNADPLAKRINVSLTTIAWASIIGVVANARTESLAEAPAPQVYLCAYQRRPKDLTIFLRGRLDAAAIPIEVRQQVQTVDPELPVFGAAWLAGKVSESLAERRFSMEMIALFGSVALLLALIGIYGVISYVVGERSHEIAIRLALGAHRGNILRMILRDGLKLAIFGIVLGLAGALVLSPLLSSLLYGVPPVDPATFAATTLLFVIVALFACYVPARRATKVDPMQALRDA
ncbi:MAG TPA: ABC transporter permease [Candidatus Acidoferrales bacterium]|nr:ABC transporter permease [Candidatus Acidoferrales bacterium]